MALTKTLKQALGRFAAAMYTIIDIVKQSQLEDLDVWQR
jgi:hypothetical protein